MKDVRNLFLMASAFALAIILFASAAVTVVHAQTYTVLYNFGGVSGDPQQPLYGPIAQGRDGNLYATTSSGGSANFGTVFKITPMGTLTVLNSLGGSIGSYPFEGLTLGRDGNFYGAIQAGGGSQAGTVFRITPDGKLGGLYSFSGDMNGSYPYAPPIQGGDGNLYGTTTQGGNSSYGTVYKITSPRQLTTLHSFTGGDQGDRPKDPLLQASDGSFYGTSDCCAFKISPKGVFTGFGALPGNTDAPMIEATDGNFYGVTYSETGKAFQMTPSGEIKVLHTFNPMSDGSYPNAGLVQASNGNLYGVATYGGILGGGTIFRVSPTGSFSVLYTFDVATGSYPYTTLVQHTNGMLYGETNSGGAYGKGVFYSLDIGAPPFARLVSTFGKIGKTIGILGQGFTGTTDVSFNGIPATFTVSSDTYLEATVPTGATTGFVTVTTSTGTLTSNQQIQIRQ